MSEISGTIARMGERFVSLYWRKNNGWPWPDSSWGLDPMYGENGWCHSCGIPTRPQSGSMVLRSSGAPTSAFWLPNWRFDAPCVRAADARPIIERFGLRVLPVLTPRSAETAFVQLLPDVAPERWWDSADLEAVTVARHGSAGASCTVCGVWRWMPVLPADLPTPTITATVGSHLVASQEWFGDGKRASRDLRYSEALAEALVALNPRVWSVWRQTDHN